MMEKSDQKSKAKPKRGDWMKYEDFWDSMTEFSDSRVGDTEHDEPFIVLDEPVAFASGRLLYVLIHPGDLVLDHDDLLSVDDNYLRDCAVDLCLAAQNEHVEEINKLQATGDIDIVVLHRYSSGHAFTDNRYVDEDYRKLIEDAQEDRAAILYGDGLPEVAEWLLTTCNTQERPAVIISGCWAETSYGSAAAIANSLHTTGCKVTLSDAAPTHYLDGDVPRWAPSARLNTPTSAEH